MYSFISNSVYQRTHLCLISMTTDAGGEADGEEEEDCSGTV